MLRKILSLGALVVVAVTFGVSSATAAKPPKQTPPGASNSNGYWSDGFSDGRD